MISFPESRAGSDQASVQLRKSYMLNEYWENFFQVCPIKVNNKNRVFVRDGQKMDLSESQCFS